MTPTDAAIDALAKCDAELTVVDGVAQLSADSVVKVVLDAAEPLIRTDEREQCVTAIRKAASLLNRMRTRHQYKYFFGGLMRAIDVIIQKDPVP